MREFQGFAHQWSLISLSDRKSSFPCFYHLKNLSLCDQALLSSSPNSGQGTRNNSQPRELLAGLAQAGAVCQSGVKGFLAGIWDV